MMETGESDVDLIVCGDRCLEDEERVGLVGVISLSPCFLKSTILTEQKSNYNSEM